jgi:hypothetical protein
MFIPLFSTQLQVLNAFRDVAGEQVQDRSDAGTWLLPMNLSLKNIDMQLICVYIYMYQFNIHMIIYIYVSVPLQGILSIHN